MGLQTGLVETERAYYDQNDFLNYGPLMKGQYSYQDLKLSSNTKSVFGINQQIHEEIDITVEFVSGKPQNCVGRLMADDYIITYGLLKGAIHYLGIQIKDLSFGLYSGGRQLLTNPTSFGINIAGSLLF